MKYSWIYIFYNIYFEFDKLIEKRVTCSCEDNLRTSWFKDVSTFKPDLLKLFFIVISE